jgi:hypothetical protein
VAFLAKIDRIDPAIIGRWWRSAKLLSELVELTGIEPVTS